MKIPSIHIEIENKFYLEHIPQHSHSNSHKRNSRIENNNIKNIKMIYEHGEGIVRDIF